MVSVDKTDNKPFYEQVVLGVKEEVLLGILEPGEKIASVREMANLLMINPNTISKAYKQLEEEEVILTIRGKGTFVKNNENSVQNHRKIEKIRKQFSDLVVEALYERVTKEELFDWVQTAAGSLGGE